MRPPIETIWLILFQTQFAAGAFRCVEKGGRQKYFVGKQARKVLTNLSYSPQSGEIALIEAMHLKQERLSSVAF
jgi:hypothetical protein